MLLDLGLRGYVVVSGAAAAAVVAHAVQSREQFYPAALYLASSKVALAAGANLALALALCAWKLTKWVFLGRLREAEVERLSERAKEAVMEICLAMTIFREEFNVPFVSLFGLLLFVKSFHWLSQDRLEHIETSPAVRMAQHVRCLSLMGALLLVDVFFLKYCVQQTVEQGPSVLLLFAFEYIVQASGVISSFIKYLIFLADSALEGAWEGKGVCVFYLELVTDLFHLFTYVIFFVIIFMFYGLPLHLVRELYWTFSNFRNRLLDFIRYRRITTNMDDRFQDATPEQLAEDNVCIICREEMTEAKRLACGHAFHARCLRSWLERQQSCPTCRAPVMPAEPPAIQRVGAGGAPAPGIFQAAAAAAVAPGAGLDGEGAGRGGDARDQPEEPVGALEADARARTDGGAMAGAGAAAGPGEAAGAGAVAGAATGAAAGAVAGAGAGAGAGERAGAETNAQGRQAPRAGEPQDTQAVHPQDQTQPQVQPPAQPRAQPHPHMQFMGAGAVGQGGHRTEQPLAPGSAAASTGGAPAPPPPEQPGVGWGPGAPMPHHMWAGHPGPYPPAYAPAYFPQPQYYAGVMHFQGQGEATLRAGMGMPDGMVMSPMPLPNMAFMPVPYPMAGPEAGTGAEPGDTGDAGVGAMPAGMQAAHTSPATVLMPPVTGLVVPVASTPEPGSQRHPMLNASASPLLSSAQRLVDSMRASPDGRADAEALQDLQRQMELLQPGLSTPSRPAGAGPSSSRTPTEAQAHPGPSGEAQAEVGAEGGPPEEAKAEAAPDTEGAGGAETPEGLRRRRLDRFNSDRPDTE